MTTCLVIMAKAPLKGNVKTRLAEVIGADSALQLYTGLLMKTLDLAAKWNGPVLLSSAGDHPIFKDSEFTVVPQHGDDLGQRMYNAGVAGLELADAVLIIGCDIPDLNLEILQEASELLDHCDVVFGPSEDGGYYLAGMRQMHKQLFEGITWSTSHVLSDSELRCEEQRLSVDKVTMLNDIDTFEDLKNSTVSGWDLRLDKPI
ncbi:MAG: TIGR04282 family arsenosugar biosynthesis glycosyltransferase [Flavobacteriales bacterium]|nr:TIGR04282 family arsenosugar biosynthesis glycosyltransferase [Flavobacteriales bacterium]